MESVSSLFVDHVSQRFPSRVSVPVVEKEIELPRPESARRNRRDVRGEKDLPKRPQVTGGGQWLFAKDVEHGAAQPTVSQANDERRLIQQRPPSHIDDNRRLREQIEAFGRQQSIRLGGLGRRQNDDVVSWQFGVQFVERNDAFEASWRA
jgi:hypothetical protein